MFSSGHKAGCISINPRGGREDTSYDPCQPEIKIPRKVLKGGARACVRRNTAAATARLRVHAELVDASTSHVGFRCVVRQAMTNALCKGAIRP
jgi:hypothetical protein